MSSVPYFDRSSLYGKAGSSRSEVYTADGYYNNNRNSFYNGNRRFGGGGGGRQQQQYKQYQYYGDRSGNSYGYNSGYGGVPSGYGYQSNSRFGGYSSGSGSGSGHSGSGGGGGGQDCCPLVVDPLTLFTLIAFIAGATYFLNLAITMNITGRKKRKKRDGGTWNLLWGGEFWSEVVGVVRYFGPSVTLSTTH